MIEDDWLWGWDPTPGIVSVWAEPNGHATVWRRVDRPPQRAGVAFTRALVREDVRFRPWLVLNRPDDVVGARVTVRELAGDGELRWLVRADDLDTLTAAVTRGASRRLGRRIGHVRELGDDAVLMLPPEEQYLVASGRTYFRDLAFDDLRRMQIDLETTGLDPAHDRVFVVAVRDPDGVTEVIEASGEGDPAEAKLIARLVAMVRAADPDVIENHNLHGFDLPFLDQRARALGVPLALGRTDDTTLRQRGARPLIEER
jgi:DNA polymerase elongation subunit (family B)